MPETGGIILGIDLGTTNSLGAYMTAAGPVVVRDAGGAALVPSVLAFGPDGQVTVGRQAKAHAVENPLSTIYSVKRLMGKSLKDVAEDLRVLPYAIKPGPNDTVLVDVAGSGRTPQELSAMVLEDIRRRAEAALGVKITQAVITVPAYFDDAQRQATRDAGRLAGLEVRRIVNEPTAAALAYGLDRKSDSCIAVYDLGGGTFDISILRCSEGVFQVLSTNGDTRLGGDDLDRELIDMLTGEIRARFGEELEFGPATRQALKAFAEEAKVRLSDYQQAKVQVDLGGGRVFERIITRDEFEARAAKWIDHTLEHCRRALADAGLAPGDIEEVVMVGGCTRIPLVRRRIAEFFGRNVYTAVNPDEVVALGAAVQAGILAGMKRDTLLLDVTPLSVGIETLGGGMGKLIMRNSAVPCMASETFTTCIDNQSAVDIHILQGERELAADCRSLGRFVLRGVPPMPAGMPRISVTFLIDANGILNVSARELKSGVEASVQVTPSHGLTAQQVDAMVKESYAHAMEDFEAHRVIDLRNEATRVINAIEKALGARGHVLAASDRARLDQAVADLKAAMKSEDGDAIDAAMRAANEAAQALTADQMNDVLRQTATGRKISEF
ncbi:MAG: molecular chaperone DnaK [Planctomycetes bacterium]|jgi:molecular chaperone DnaK|nr:molecular chaperone DnaK [Planctomycetota bacterium]